MSLSEKTKSYLKYSLANQEVADEVILYLETDPDSDAALAAHVAAGGSGVSVAAGGVFVVTTLTLFDVAAGAGYCVKGAGSVIYDAVSFNHIPVVQPRNTKFQNTLTVVQLPTAPTLAP